MLLGGFNDSLEESHVDHFGGRIVRKTDDQHFRLRPSLANRLFEVAEKRFAGGERYATQIAAGKHHGKLMNRVSRTGTEHDVARIDGRPGEMRYPLFRADRHDRLAIGIEIDVVAAFVPTDDGQAQFVNAARHRITVVLRFARGFDELGDHVRRSGQIGIAHAEVDDVLTSVPSLHLHAVDDAENVGRQPLYALKFHAWVPKPFSKDGITSFYKPSSYSVQLNRSQSTPLRVIGRRCNDRFLGPASE